MLAQGRPLQGCSHAGLGTHIGATGNHALFLGLPRPVQRVAGLASNYDWLATLSWGAFRRSRAVGSAVVRPTLAVSPRGGARRRGTSGDQFDTGGVPLRRLSA
jgi:hypothetical protein